MAQSTISGIAPFFIVRDAMASINFYRDKLGFNILYQEPAQDPFFVILGRDRAMLMIKRVAARPQPNPERDPDARWDAYLSVQDADALATEFALRGVSFSVPLGNTHEGLRGFELADPDGYVLFFGHPRG